jgi:hypothetical protein
MGGLIDREAFALVGEKDGQRAARVWGARPPFLRELERYLFRETVRLPFGLALDRMPAPCLSLDAALDGEQQT